MSMSQCSLSPYGDARARWADILCLSVLCGIGVLLRWPWLDAIAFNPDESEYASVAAFVLAQDGSPCTFPNSDLVFTIGIYKALAAVFGPFCVTPLRVLVLLISLALAALVYLLVRRHANWYFGFAAGLLFLLYNISFEGLSANREWFSILPLFVAVFLCDRLKPGASRWQDLRLLAAGALSGVGIWFKEQALFPALAIPLWLLAGALAERDWRGAARRIAVYVAGGLLAGLVYLIPFLATGTLAEHLMLKLTIGRQYASDAPPAADSWYRALYYYYFSRGPHSEILGIVYAVAVFVLARMAWQVVRPGATGLILDRPIARLVALQLVLAMYTVQVGQRFYHHYYLFMMPAAAVLFGLGLGALQRDVPLPGGKGEQRHSLASALRWALPPLVALLLLRQLAWIDVWLGFTIVPVVIAAVTVFCLAASWQDERLRTLVLGAAPSASCVPLLLGLLPVLPPYYPTERQFTEIAAEIRRVAGPEDRLFVWGWQPIIYASTRLEPATRFCTCRVIALDFTAAAELQGIHDFALAELVRDLERAPPRFIVDASGATVSMKPYANLYALERFAEFEKFLQTHYSAIATKDKCVLYERR